ncbi:MAG: LytTR family DNA-binding domain-containing protein [Cytophagales bacterium]|nr:LytTR family DNA-binding domain-containing protein [Cytophagales bacterium]
MLIDHLNFMELTGTFTRPIQDLRVFDFRPKTAGIRYGVALLLALINALLRSDHAIFSNEFEFPWSIFWYGFLFVFVVCSSSWIATSILKKRLFETGELNPATASKFLVVNVIVALIVYSCLYWAINGQIYPRHYFLYFILTIAVVSIENLIYLLYCSFQSPDFSIDKPQTASTDLIISMGQKQIILPQREIELIELKNELILFHSKGKVITSQFESMEALEKLLSAELFFRANRQVIINRHTIKEIKKGENRKLSIQLNGSIPIQGISVSRYRRKDLLTWIKTQRP